MKASIETNTDPLFDVYCLYAVLRGSFYRNSKEDEASTPNGDRLAGSVAHGFRALTQYFQTPISIYTSCPTKAVLGRA